MIGNQLRERIDRLGMTYREAARLLGLTYGGLHHQLRGDRAVTRQTELLLERIEAERAAARLPPPLSRRGRRPVARRSAEKR